MTLVTRLSEACDAVVTLLKGWSEELDYRSEDVYYGDQSRLPRSPSVCVEPGEKVAELYGASRMTEVGLNILVLVYHSEIKNVEENRRNADTLAESIADRLNLDATLGGRAIHCFVSNVSSGYATKDTSTMRASRITFLVTSRELLPNNP